MTAHVIAIFATVTLAALAGYSRGFSRGLRRGKALGWLEHYDETLRRDTARRAAMCRNNDGTFKEVKR